MFCVGDVLNFFYVCPFVCCFLFVFVRYVYFEAYFHYVSGFIGIRIVSVRKDIG
jgi:hypothetical protein